MSDEKTSGPVTAPQTANVEKSPANVTTPPTSNGTSTSTTNNTVTVKPKENIPKSETNDVKNKSETNGEKKAETKNEAPKEDKPKPPTKTSRKRKSTAGVKYNSAASSPRKTRSSDFYTSMVAEAIKQSEIEAKKSEQKQEKQSKKGTGSPNQPVTKKAPKAFSRVISSNNYDFDDDKPEDIKIGSKSATENKKAKKSKKSEKSDQKKEESETESTGSDFRSFGELKSALKNSTTLDLAKKLIGVNLCRRVDGQKLIGKIVETEAYLGSVDQCALTYKKKKSKVLKSYFEDAGSCCVEFLDNGGRQVAVSSALPGEYVLIRALQPMLGREKMKSLRGLKNKTTDKDLAKDATTTCQALKVGLDHDCLDLLEGGGDLWIEPGAKCSTVIRTRRVLDMHDEKNWNQWSFKKYRFYDSKASCISVRDTKEDKNQVRQSEAEIDPDS